MELVIDTYQSLYWPRLTLTVGFSLIVLTVIGIEQSTNTNGRVSVRHFGVLSYIDFDRSHKKSNKSNKNGNLNLNIKSFI
jgi:hypothetical protein